MAYESKQAITSSNFEPPVLESENENYRRYHSVSIMAKSKDARVATLQNVQVESSKGLVTIPQVSLSILHIKIIDILETRGW